MSTQSVAAYNAAAQGSRLSDPFGTPTNVAGARVIANLPKEQGKLIGQYSGVNPEGYPTRISYDPATNSFQVESIQAHGGTAGAVSADDVLGYANILGNQDLYKAAMAAKQNGAVSATSNLQQPAANITAWDARLPVPSMAPVTSTTPLQGTQQSGLATARTPEAQGMLDRLRAKLQPKFEAGTTRAQQEALMGGTTGTTGGITTPMGTTTGATTGTTNLTTPGTTTGTTTTTSSQSKALDLLLPTEQEQALQRQIDAILSGTQLSQANIEDETIPMPFITGQQASVERRALAAVDPLERQLARLQAARQAQQTYETEKSKIEEKKTAKQEADTKKIDAELATFEEGIGKFLESYGLLPSDATQKVIADLSPLIKSGQMTGAQALLKYQQAAASNPQVQKLMAAALKKSLSSGTSGTSAADPFALNFRGIFGKNPTTLDRSLVAKQLSASPEKNELLVMQEMKVTQELMADNVAKEVALDLIDSVEKGETYEEVRDAYQQIYGLTPEQTLLPYLTLGQRL